MGWNSVAPFVRTRLNALGYREHDDAFNTANVAKSIIHDSYHVELGPIQGIDLNQDCQVTECGFVVRVFRRGFRKPREERDLAIADGQEIVEDIIAVVNRINEPAFHNIFFDALSFEPIADSNDNTFIMVLEFRALVILDGRGV